MVRRENVGKEVLGRRWKGDREKERERESELGLGMVPLPSLLSVALLNTMLESSLEEERVYLTYTSRSQSGQELKQEQR